LRDAVAQAGMEGDSRMVRVKQLLARKGNDVWSVDAEEPVLGAIQIMADRHIGALPVTRNGELVGIVSERDYARKVILLGRSSAETPVWQIMSSPVVTVSPGEGVRQCMQMMTERRIRHLPVLDGGRLVGVISIGDLVRAVIEEQDQTIEQLERFIVG
jgi:CBS domain-containing protein